MFRGIWRFIWSGGRTVTPIDIPAGPFTCSPPSASFACGSLALSFTCGPPAADFT